MPDNMSSEQPKSSIDYMRSLGKPAELPANQISSQAAKEFPQPEARGYVPDIKMMAGGDDEEAARKSRQLREMLDRDGRSGTDYEDSYSMREGYIGSLVRELKSLAREKNEPEKENIREKIAETRIRVLHSSLDELDTLNRYLDGLKNPYPYDSRWSMQLFETVSKNINMALREKNPERSLDEEGMAFLKSMKIDMAWATSLARVCEAMGPAYEMYFDGELELSRLRSVHTELLAGDFANVFKKNISGLALTSAEKELTKKIISKTPDKYMENDERYGNLKEKTLREVSVEYQDAYDFWSLSAIAASQKNLESGFNDANTRPGEGDLEQGEHYKEIDKVTFDFLNKLFRSKDADVDGLIYINERGEKFRVQDQLLNPYNMPRTDEPAFKSYYARMHELVVDSKKYKSVLEKLKSGLENKSITQDQVDAEVNSLVNNIIDAANKRVITWESLDEKNPYDRVADVVVKSMINLERGLLSCGELGWGYAYKKVPLGEITSGMSDDEKDKYLSENKARIQIDSSGEQFIVKRKSELGSIYDNHDVTTVVFWARHIVDYDTLAETRGSVLFPTIGSYRSRWESEPPYFKPEIKEFAKDDKDLLRRYNELTSPVDRFAKTKARGVYKQGSNGLQVQEFGAIDSGVKKYIEDNAWAYQTPFLNDPAKGDFYLTMPVFLPSYIADINFYRTLCLEKPGAKPRDYPKQSVWHQRLGGTELSSMKWENMDRYKYNWALVTGDQMERWLGPWITPAEFNRATKDEFEKHTGMPGGKAEKESGKRARLGGRGGLVSEGILRATIFTQNKVLAAVGHSGVMGVDVKNVGDTLNINSTELKLKLDEWRKTWIAPWVNTLLDMPGSVRGVKNYPGTSAFMLIFSYIQARRVVASAIVNAYGQTGDANGAIANIEKTF